MSIGEVGGRSKFGQLTKYISYTTCASVSLQKLRPCLGHIQETHDEWWPDECGPTISDQTKQQCHNKWSMITPEAWTPVIINSQCSSIKWIEHSTKYILPMRIQETYIYA